jgi:hypothetical protein
MAQYLRPQGFGVEKRSHDAEHEAGSVNRVATKE